MWVTKYVFRELRAMLLAEYQGQQNKSLASPLPEGADNPSPQTISVRAPSFLSEPSIPLKSLRMAYDPSISLKTTKSTMSN